MSDRPIHMKISNSTPEAAEQGPPVNVKIVSDNPCASATYLYNAETGERIFLPITDITLYIKDGMWKADISMFIHKVNIEAKVVRTRERCFMCKSTIETNKETEEKYIVVGEHVIQLPKDILSS